MASSAWGGLRGVSTRGAVGALAEHRSVGLVQDIRSCLGDVSGPTATMSAS